MFQTIPPAFPPLERQLPGGGASGSLSPRRPVDDGSAHFVMMVNDGVYQFRAKFSCIYLCFVFLGGGKLSFTRTETPLGQNKYLKAGFSPGVLFVALVIWMDHLAPAACSLLTPSNLSFVSEGTPP